ncbi:MAG: GPI anchored serine-threonine rich family protein [Bacteroidia bacterium]|nr:GPI anchored serine-threonine rich family protein [Bacteroidia bacterium]
MNYRQTWQITTMLPERGMCLQKGAATTCLFFSLLIFTCLNLTAQSSVQNVNTSLEDDKIRIKYSLKDSVSARLFSVKLFAKTSSGSIPLTKIEGEYGDNITIGEHEVVWDALAELERFSGNVAIEVQATPEFMFLSPKRDQSVKRGKAVTFSWYGANSTMDQITVELYRYDELLETLGTLNQQGSYTWQVPGDMKASDGYRIKITGTEITGNMAAFSPPVRVMQKIPVLYKYIGLGTIVTGATVTVIQLLRALPPIFVPE